jgi:hypothetical protein
VKDALITSLLKDKIENACNWSAELICSGQYTVLWEIILFFFSRHICLGNPKIPIYIKKRYDLFRNIITKDTLEDEVDLRNNETIRELFAEIVCILTFSKKKNCIEYVKIDREEEFDMTKNKHLLKAPTLEYAMRVMIEDDPKELSIAINELVYSLSIKNIKMSCYWVEWIIEFDAICRSRKEPCYCAKRLQLHVENKHKKDIIWLVWDSILHESKNHVLFVKETNLALFDLFCIRYTKSCCTTRRYIIYYAISILIEPFDLNLPIIEEKRSIHFIKNKIHEVYKQIKKNRQTNNNNDTEEYDTIENECVVDSSAEEQDSTPL